MNRPLHTISSTMLAIGLLASLPGPAHAAPRCAWVEPGAAPYGPQGDPVAAVMRLTTIPEPHRSILADSVRLDTPADVQRITRSGIGDGRRWVQPRNMNFAGGAICWGELDTSMWPASRSQIVRIHSSGPYAVGFYPGCGNVGEMTDAAYRAPAPGVLGAIRSALGIQAPRQAQAQVAGAQVAQDVPEPGTWALLALAGVAMVLVRRKVKL